MADVLDSLIADAYGSLTGPDGHTTFMRSLARAFRSHLIAYQVDRPGHEHVPLSHYDQQGKSNSDMAAVISRQPYVNPYFESPAAMRLLREGVADEQGCIEPAKLRATEFYSDILRPFDIFHSVGFVLQQGNASSVLTISRSSRSGFYQTQELQFGKQLLPHLRNIHAIQKVVAEGSWTSAGASVPAWVLGAHGHICGRNEQAVNFKNDADSIIGERAGRLWPCHPQDQAALDAEISNVLAGIRLCGRAPIRDKAGTPRYIAHIRHCRREAFLTWLLTDPPAVLVVLQPLACDSRALEPVLIRLYGLTQAECRVAGKLLELESIHLVAADLSRSEETIRSQLKAVFAKTGTHSQAQLLKLLYALGHS